MRFLFKLRYNSVLPITEASRMPHEALPVFLRQLPSILQGFDQVPGVSRDDVMSITRFLGEFPSDAYLFRSIAMVGRGESERVVTDINYIDATARERLITNTAQASTEVNALHVRLEPGTEIDSMVISFRIMRADTRRRRVIESPSSLHFRISVNHTNQVSITPLTGEENADPVLVNRGAINGGQLRQIIQTNIPPEVATLNAALIGHRNVQQRALKENIGMKTNIGFDAAIVTAMLPRAITLLEEQYGVSEQIIAAARETGKIISEDDIAVPYITSADKTALTDLFRRMIIFYLETIEPVTEDTLRGIIQLTILDYRTSKKMLYEEFGFTTRGSIELAAQVSLYAGPAVLEDLLLLPHSELLPLSKDITAYAIRNPKGDIVEGARQMYQIVQRIKTEFIAIRPDISIPDSLLYKLIANYGVTYEVLRDRILASIQLAEQHKDETDAYLVPPIAVITMGPDVFLDKVTKTLALMDSPGFQYLVDREGREYTSFSVYFYIVHRYKNYQERLATLQQTIDWLDNIFQNRGAFVPFTLLLRGAFSTNPVPYVENSMRHLSKGTFGAYLERREKTLLEQRKLIELILLHGDLPHPDLVKLVRASGLSVMPAILLLHYYGRRVQLMEEQMSSGNIDEQAVDQQVKAEIPAIVVEIAQTQVHMTPETSDVEIVGPDDDEADDTPILDIGNPDGPLDAYSLYLRSLPPSFTAEDNAVRFTQRQALLSSGTVVQNTLKQIDDAITLGNLRLVVKTARYYRITGIDINDLISYGNMGLLTAITKYDVNGGYKFSTVATQHIRAAIARGMRSSERAIPLPSYAVTLHNKISNYLAQHASAESEEIATALHISRTTVEVLLSLPTMGPCQKFGCTN